MKRSDRRLLLGCLVAGVLALAFVAFFVGRAFEAVADHADIYDTHIEHEER